MNLQNKIVQAISKNEEIFGPDVKTRSIMNFILEYARHKYEPKSGIVKQVTVVGKFPVDVDKTKNMILGDSKLRGSKIINSMTITFTNGRNLGVPLHLSHLLTFYLETDTMHDLRYFVEDFNSSIFIGSIFSVGIFLGELESLFQKYIFEKNANEFTDRLILTLTVFGNKLLHDLNKDPKDEDLLGMFDQVDSKFIKPELYRIKDGQLDHMFRKFEEMKTKLGRQNVTSIREISEQLEENDLNIENYNIDMINALKKFDPDKQTIVDTENLSPNMENKNSTNIIEGNADNLIEENEIVGDPIDGNEIAGDAIDGNEIAGDAIDGNENVGDAIEGNEIVGDAIEGNEIVGDVIDGNENAVMENINVEVGGDDDEIGDVGFMEHQPISNVAQQLLVEEEEEEIDIESLFTNNDVNYSAVLDVMQNRIQSFSQTVLEKVKQIISDAADIEKTSIVFIYAAYRFIKTSKGNRLCEDFLKQFPASTLRYITTLNVRDLVSTILPSNINLNWIVEENDELTPEYYFCPAQLWEYNKIATDFSYWSRDHGFEYIGQSVQRTMLTFLKRMKLKPGVLFYTKLWQSHNRSNRLFSASRRMVVAFHTITDIESFIDFAEFESTLATWGDILTDNESFEEIIDLLNSILFVHMSIEGIVDNKVKKVLNSIFNLLNLKLRRERDIKMSLKKIHDFSNWIDEETKFISVCYNVNWLLAIPSKSEIQLNLEIADNNIFDENIDQNVIVDQENRIRQIESFMFDIERAYDNPLRDNEGEQVNDLDPEIIEEQRNLLFEIKQQIGVLIRIYGDILQLFQSNQAQNNHIPAINVNMLQRLNFVANAFDNFLQEGNEQQMIVPRQNDVANVVNNFISFVNGNQNRPLLNNNLSANLRVLNMIVNMFSDPRIFLNGARLGDMSRIDRILNFADVNINRRDLGNEMNRILALGNNEIINENIVNQQNNQLQIAPIIDNQPENEQNIGNFGAFQIHAFQNQIRALLHWLGNMSNKLLVVTERILQNLRILRRPGNAEQPQQPPDNNPIYQQIVAIAPEIAVEQKKTGTLIKIGKQLLWVPKLLIYDIVLTQTWRIAKKIPSLVKKLVKTFQYAYSALTLADTLTTLETYQKLVTKLSSLFIFMNLAEHAFDYRNAILGVVDIVKSSLTTSSAMVSIGIISGAAMSGKYVYDKFQEKYPAVFNNAKSLFFWVWAGIGAYVSINMLGRVSFIVKYITKFFKTLSNIPGISYLLSGASALIGYAWSTSRSATNWFLSWASTASTQYVFDQAGNVTSTIFKQAETVVNLFPENMSPVKNFFDMSVASTMQDIPEEALKTSANYFAFVFDTAKDFVFDTASTWWSSLLGYIQTYLPKFSWMAKFVYTQAQIGVSAILKSKIYYTSMFTTAVLIVLAGYAGFKLYKRLKAKHKLSMTPANESLIKQHEDKLEQVIESVDEIRQVVLPQTVISKEKLGNVMDKINLARYKVTDNKIEESLKRVLAQKETTQPIVQPKMAIENEPIETKNVEEKQPDEKEIKIEKQVPTKLIGTKRRRYEIKEFQSYYEAFVNPNLPVKTIELNDIVEENVDKNILIIKKL